QGIPVKSNSQVRACRTHWRRKKAFLAGRKISAVCRGTDQIVSLTKPLGLPQDGVFHLSRLSQICLAGLLSHSITTASGISSMNCQNLISRTLRCLPRFPISQSRNLSSETRLRSHSTALRSPSQSI